MDGALAFAASLDEDNHAGRKQAAAIDLSHHLGDLAKARRFSPLKSFSKYMGIPGIISLAGGLPDPSYFPLETVQASLLSEATYDAGGRDSETKSKGWFSGWFGGSPSKPSVQQITVPKYEKSPTRESLQLATALQYGSAEGLVFLQNFIGEWTSLVSPPAYEDWGVLLDDGSTDGWHKVVELLCNPGDQILVEAWTYPSAIESGWPMGVRPVPVAIDADGLIPEALDKTLSDWDEQAHGRRPRLLYTVPVGQNPTGSIITDERRKQIYNVCVKHDIIICEDDPYYILQFPFNDHSNSSGGSSSEDNRSFVRSLSPSYLKFDTQGRVIRLDTFSKTIAPGSRLGWITSNSLFSERLLRASEVSTQQPSGFSQVVVGKILETWGMDGWVRWLRGLRTQYRERRDVSVEALKQGFKIETARPFRSTSNSGSRNVKMVGYAKYSSIKRTPVRTLDLDEKFSSFGLSEGRPPLISFVPPEAGMFIWINVHVANHRRFNRNASSEERRKTTRDLMNELWEVLAQNNLLIAPGWMFAGDGLRAGAPDDSKKPAANLEDCLTILKDEEEGIGHFRLAFSFSTHDRLREGCRIFAEVVTKFFEH